MPLFLGAMHLYALRVLATATCLGGWLAVCHSRYCIKTTKPILKLFRPPGRTIIEAFGTPSVDTKFQGEPLHRGYIYTGVGKIADFRRKWPISRKRCETEREPGLRVTGHRVSNLGPGRVGSRVKALTRLFDPDSYSML